MELYERIKKRREELDLSQDELAQKLGYKSRSTIAKIEKGGKRHYPIKNSCICPGLTNYSKYFDGVGQYRGYSAKQKK
jgi:DNA-binding XRE family transcriptional regulator